MTTARHASAQFALFLFMLHCNIGFPTARHLAFVVGAGIGAELYLICDRTEGRLAGIGGGRHRGLVVR